MIVFCPNCDRKSEVSDEILGRRVRCPQCHAVFRLSPSPDVTSTLVPPFNRQTNGGDPYPEDGPTHAAQPLREVLESATSKAGKAVRQARDHHVVKSCLECATDLKKGIVASRALGGLPASDWMNLAVLIGLAAFVTLIGPCSPMVEGIFLLCSIWVYRDARLRGNSALVWSLSTVPFGFMTLPFYFSTRHLREGEVREGGRTWNILKFFAVYWTITMALFSFAGLMAVSKTAANASSDAYKVGVAIGATLGLGWLFLVWFVPFVWAVLIGLLLRKSTTVERGGTKVLESHDHSSARPFLIAGAAGLLIVLTAGSMYKGSGSDSPVRTNNEDVVTNGRAVKSSGASADQGHQNTYPTAMFSGPFIHSAGYIKQLKMMWQNGFREDALKSMSSNDLQVTNLRRRIRVGIIDHRSDYTVIRVEEDDLELQGNGFYMYKKLFVPNTENW